jgi:transcriptional regulator with XRE-family HTH domain
MSEIQTTGRRREVGAELKRIRKQTNQPAYKVAERLGWTPSHISRSEAGKRRVTDVDAGHYLGICDAPDDELQRLLKIVNEPDDYRLQTHEGGISDQLRTLVFFESTATQIRSFEPIFIPGIAQTADYARALFMDAGVEDPSSIEEFVRARTDRTAVLTRPNPPKCWYYIHENALRLPIGSPRVMAEQLLHLLFLGDNPACAIRVVPVSGGGRGAVGGGFQIFGFKEDPSVVAMHHATTSEFLETDEEVASYRRSVRRVDTVALDGAQSRQWLAQLASDFERQGDAWDDPQGPGRLAQE